MKVFAISVWYENDNPKQRPAKRIVRYDDKGNRTFEEGDSAQIEMKGQLIVLAEDEEAAIEIAEQEVGKDFSESHVQCLADLNEFPDGTVLLKDDI